ncbi:hypothetical protein V1478_011956 [Vespula squamosa]|uniref:Uncharacterized protein n=1 Tax=Vespula squamosa TaxID=30214 RepID=A0ABD2AC33_VESSQ
MADATRTGIGVIIFRCRRLGFAFCSSSRIRDLERRRRNIGLRRVSCIHVIVQEDVSSGSFNGHVNELQFRPEVDKGESEGFMKRTRFDISTALPFFAGKKPREIMPMLGFTTFRWFEEA